MDATESQRSVAALEPISATTEELLDSAPDGVLIVDTAGMIRLVNRKAEALFGYGHGELAGRPIEILVPEPAKADLDGSRAAYFRSPTARSVDDALDRTALKKDGTEFSADVTLSLLRTDQGVFVSANVKDSSERKKTENQVQGRAATSRLASIVEFSDDAMMAKTLEGVITTWNSAAEQMYGYSADEIIGHSVAELMLPARVVELGPILERLKRGERVENFETKRVRKDGSILDLSVTISPIRDGRGVVTGASTVARDLTEKKKAEAASRTLEEQLHQAQRLESIGQLAGGVAHDFNNLLAGIMNYADLVSSSLQDEMSSRGLSDVEAFVTIAQDVEEITNVARRAAALTHQLLVFSRREVVRPEVLDLNAVVCDLEDLLRRAMGENVDDLRIICAPDLPLVKADRGQIDQVLMNLAVNARDAMPGGGMLEIETARFELDPDEADLRSIGAGTYALLSISDTGTGMSAEVAERAFDPFFTTKPKGEGTGLGLATVYGIVTQAGGDVAIYSGPGVGTTIRISLPMTSDAESGPSAADLAEERSARGETLLLVEDEETVREPARRMLAREGYTVLAAASADDALEVMSRHPGAIDLLLTDVMMPGRSGRELAAVVLERSPATRVLFMSGYSHDVIVHEGVLDEGVSLIEKPFSTDAMLVKIRDVLDATSP
ncbi:MAG: hypothetical protein QOG03_844 [Actinomycetota bacterium]|nr:hypothetical protein [Actinomycetota bacterium]